MYAVAGTAADGAHAVALGREQIRLVLTSADGARHPAAAYVGKHGDGVADIALTVADAAAAWSEAVRRGARPVSAPAGREGVISASITGFGDVLHTFVQRPAEGDLRTLPGFVTAPVRESRFGSGLSAIDHFAVCLEAGMLRSTVEFYQRVLGFRVVFGERIVVGDQAMDSTVVQSRSGAVTLTLIEPDTSRSPGQIEHFVRNHGGAGVQHIAFVTDDIVGTVRQLDSHGVGFLSSPGTYYDRLAERIPSTKYPVPALRSLGILVDEDHDGQLLQIFTKPLSARGTIFMEIIERVGARTFGSGNIKALYEAVELEQAAGVRP
jgi:4-hydroxymandelate synthase